MFLSTHKTNLLETKGQKLNDFQTCDCYATDLILVGVGRQRCFTSLGLESSGSSINDNCHKFTSHQMNIYIVDHKLIQSLVEKQKINIKRSIDNIYILPDKIKQKHWIPQKKSTIDLFYDQYWIRETFVSEKEKDIAYDTIQHSHNHQEMQKLNVFGNKIYNVLGIIWEDNQTNKLTNINNNVFVGSGNNSIQNGHSALNTCIKKININDY